MKNWASSRKDHFPKPLFTLSQCRITEDDGSGDLLSRSRMHVNEWDKVALTAQQRRKRKTRCVGDSWLFIVFRSVMTAHIYRKDLPRITTFDNRLDLSLSKRIRHKLIVKTNGKRKLWTYEALSQILPYHSCTRRAPMPIVSPRPVRPNEQAHVCDSPFLVSSTLLQVNREQLTI
jgi:hypothetical protein